ncbi:MAG TPA: hypothetical protein VII46_03545, partial [Acidimicrobiales bacterium]
PVQHLIGAHALSQLPPVQQHALTGRSFFPGLISAPFRAGLHAALDFAIVASLLAAGASWLRGGRYVYSEPAQDGAVGSIPSDDAHPAPVREGDAEPAVIWAGTRDDVSGAAIAHVEAG